MNEFWTFLVDVKTAAWALTEILAVTERVRPSVYLYVCLSVCVDL